MNDPNDPNDLPPVIDPDREGATEQIGDIINRLFQVGDYVCAGEGCTKQLTAVPIGTVCVECDAKRKQVFVKGLFRVVWDRFRSQVPTTLHHAMNGDPRWRDRWPADVLDVSDLRWPQSVVLGGSSNAGKSTLAMGILSLYATHLVRAAYADPDPREVINPMTKWRYRAAQTLAEESLAAFIIPADVRRAPLLMIDDLGMDDTNDRRRIVIRDLLQERFDYGRCTLITTSLPMEAIEERYGAGIVTRIRRHAVTVQVQA